MSPVHLEVKDHIAVVTLDFPPVNAVAAQAYVELTEIFDSLHEHPEARVAVLTGAGTKAFCAGADIKARVAGTTAPRADHGRTARETFNAIYECPIPFI
ncbi:MAG: enoyl-CoA hydratase/isomerase family protein, partial [Chloroflexi bacterium]|nr:enoyl-CoA hydratase/isomerase family protein [Chloroflexota bacterium]